MKYSHKQKCRGPGTRSSLVQVCYFKKKERKKERTNKKTFCTWLPDETGSTGVLIRHPLHWPLLSTVKQKGKMNLDIFVKQINCRHNEQGNVSQRQCRIDKVKKTHQLMFITEVEESHNCPFKWIKCLRTHGVCLLLFLCTTIRSLSDVNQYQSFFETLLFESINCIWSLIEESGSVNSTFYFKTIYLTNENQTDTLNMFTCTPIIQF